MNDNLIRSRSRGSGRTADCALDVVMACEDFSAGMHALCTFDRIFPVLEKEVPLGAQSIWKFDMLSIATLREISAQEAAAADLIIIALHASGNLTNIVTSWVEMWLEYRGQRPGALALLLDDTTTDAAGVVPVEAWLKEHAAGAGMEFFVHKVPGRRDFDDLDLATDPEKRARTFATFRETLFTEAVEKFRDWSAGGVNRGFDV